MTKRSGRDNPFYHVEGKIPDGQKIKNNKETIHVPCNYSIVDLIDYLMQRTAKKEGEIIMPRCNPTFIFKDFLYSI